MCVAVRLQRHDMAHNMAICVCARTHNWPAGPDRRGDHSSDRCRLWGGPDGLSTLPGIISGGAQRLQGREGLEGSRDV